MRENRLTASSLSLLKFSQVMETKNKNENLSHVNSNRSITVATWKNNLRQSIYEGSTVYHGSATMIEVKITDWKLFKGLLNRSTLDLLKIVLQNKRTVCRNFLDGEISYLLSVSRTRLKRSLMWSLWKVLSSAQKWPSTNLQVVTFFLKRCIYDKQKFCNHKRIDFWLFKQLIGVCKWPSTENFISLVWHIVRTRFLKGLLSAILQKCGHTTRK